MTTVSRSAAGSSRFSRSADVRQDDRDVILFVALGLVYVEAREARRMATIAAAATAPSDVLSLDYWQERIKDVASGKLLERLFVR